MPHPLDVNNGFHHAITDWDGTYNVSDVQPPLFQDPVATRYTGTRRARNQITAIV